MSKVTEAFKDWQELTVDNLLGGLVLDTDSELLEKNEFTRLDNWVLRDKKLKKDTGYEQYLDAVRGNPRKHVSYVEHSGTIREVLITDATVYLRVNAQWRYISNGTDTTLSGDEAGGQVALSVADITGFADNDYIGVVLDSGQMHFSQVNGAPAAGVITIDDALPSLASTGNAVVKAVSLNGVAGKHVTAVALPWDNWLVFTNGVDYIKRFDPDTLTVEDLAGLTDTTSATLAIFDNSLVLGNTTEGGTRYPFRLRYCAKGDVTAWTTLEAGYIDIMDATHDILQLLGLGPYLIAYRDGSIGRISISGSGNRRFDTVTAVAGVGVFCNYAAVDLIDKHIVWGNNNFFWYRGGFSVEEIGNPVKDYVFGPAGVLTHVEGARGQAFAVQLPKNNEILFFHHAVHDDEHLNEVLRYALDYNKWAKRIFADTMSGFGEHIVSDSVVWDDLTGTWEEQVSSWAGFDATGEQYDIVLCSATDLTSKLYDYQEPTDDGEDIVAIAETKDFSHPSYTIRHDSLEIAVQGGNVLVEYSLDKGVTWTTLGTATGGAQATMNRMFKQFTSRVFRYRFTTSDPVTITYYNVHFKYDFQW